MLQNGASQVFRWMSTTVGLKLRNDPCGLDGAVHSAMPSQRFEDTAELYARSMSLYLDLILPAPSPIWQIMDKSWPGQPARQDALTDRGKWDY